MYWLHVSSYGCFRFEDWQQGGRQEAGLGGRQWSGERHDGGREVCKGGGKRFEVVGVVHNEVGVGHEEEDDLLGWTEAVTIMFI